LPRAQRHPRYGHPRRGSEARPEGRAAALRGCHPAADPLQPAPTHGLCHTVAPSSLPVARSNGPAKWPHAPLAGSSPAANLLASPACRGRKTASVHRSATRCGSLAAPAAAARARLLYKGYWSPADTVKGRAQLEEMHQRGNCPWMIWDPERSGIAAPASSPAPALAAKDRFRGTCRSGGVSWRGCARGRWRRSRRRGSAAVPASTEPKTFFDQAVMCL
jgi:hypothetical protein